MPGGMIERIAAMVQQMHGEPDQTWQYYADTAYAIMRDLREPTKSLKAAGENKIGVEAWKAMIDQALSEESDVSSGQAMVNANVKHRADYPVSGEPLGSTGA